jgi:hypothetical protein
MQIFEATPENLRELQGHKVRMNPGEGVLVVKLTAVTPRTMATAHDIVDLVNDHPGYIFVGSMSEIKAAITGNFDSVANDYAEAVKEFNNESEGIKN